MPWKLSWQLAVWGVPAALMTAQSYFYDSTGGIAPLAIREGAPWVIWIAVTPAILAAAARPGALRGRRLVGHVVAALAIGVAFGATLGALAYAVHPWHDAPTFGSSVAMGIVDWLPLQPLVYAGVLATGLALDAVARRRAAELDHAHLEAQLAEARLSALRAQLQPHFLFNTLNAAVTLARAGDSEGTARILVLLSDLLRQLLRTDAPQQIPLADELRLLETYLEIQHVRFGERLSVRWQIDDRARDALVPQLVLQPLVENALRHGIARRAKSGCVEIAAERAGEALQLAVRDNGPGLPPGFSLGEATGVGLRNTAERLRRLYGANAELRLTSEDDHTTASVTLPWRVAHA